MPRSPLHEPVLQWYAESARDLPWRRAGTSPWAVLVSEVMLQQTPVARVLPVYDAWVRRWPCPDALAADSAGNAIRLWGKLGYPRRALRLHQAATAITSRFGGHVPATASELLSLPGVGDYTAAAVLAFAHRRRAAPLDTNVRRVLARLLFGEARAAAATSAAERRAAMELLPDDDSTAATWSAAVMELGATVCRARSPLCTCCPVADLCRWRRKGYPSAADALPHRAQAYDGTDRQCRGAVLATVRSSGVPVPPVALSAAWPADDQRQRAVSSLLADGLLIVTTDGNLALP